MISAAALVVGLRLALGLVGWASVQVWPITVVGGDHLELLLSGQSRAWPTLGPWQRWDALWYHHLAAAGYTDPQTDTAFYPLYPALVRLVGTVTAGDYLLAGLLVSTLATIAGLALLHRLVAADHDVATADRAVLYCAVAPAAFFFLAPFTEGLFLALSVATVLAARRRRFALGGGLGALAATSRVAGVLLAAPLAVEALADVRERRRGGERGLRRGHLATLLPVAAFAAWNGWVVVHYGVADGTFGPASRVWGVHPTPPWTALREALDALPHHLEEMVNVVSVVGLAVALPLMVGRLPWSLVVYAALSFAVVACHQGVVTPLESAARYTTVVFPLFVLLALAGRRLWVDRLVLTTFPVLMTALFLAFVHFVFVG